MLVSGIAQSGQNLALSRLAIKSRAFQEQIYHNELLKVSKFTVNKQDNSCDNSTNKTERLFMVKLIIHVF